MIKILAQASVFLILDVMKMKLCGFVRCSPFVCISAIAESAIFCYNQEDFPAARCGAQPWFLCGRLQVWLNM